MEEPQYLDWNNSFDILDKAHEQDCCKWTKIYIRSKPMVS